MKRKSKDDLSVTVALFFQSLLSKRRERHQSTVPLFPILKNWILWNARLGARPAVTAGEPKQIDSVSSSSTDRERKREICTRTHLNKSKNVSKGRTHKKTNPIDSPKRTEMQTIQQVNHKVSSSGLLRSMAFIEAYIGYTTAAQNETNVNRTLIIVVVAVVLILLLLLLLLLLCYFFVVNE